jgi:2-deoxy-D-gluconate 3-dehydrogenase
VVNMFDLTGRLAVVTGAKRGIGYAMAETLSAAGANIIGVSATLEPDGSAISAAVLAHGRSFEAHTVDLADRDAVLALGTELARRAPDILGGQPSDLGGATVFLASAASDYVNGITLPVDGGWLGR